MGFRTFTIGRTRRADIRLDDGTVSRLHAELTLTSSERCYLTDRGSLRGTWLYRDGKWDRHRQGYVEIDDRLRFGKFEVRLAALLKNRTLGLDHREAGWNPISARPRRDKSSGEIKV